MFKRYCDICKKTIGDDFTIVEFHRGKDYGYGHFDVCMSCWEKKKNVDMLEKRVATKAKIRR